MRYVCPGSLSNVPFFCGCGRIQREWTCRCGATAIADEIAPVPPKEVKPARTHWDMLMERRTRAELEELLEERLALLRASREEAELPRSA